LGFGAPDRGDPVHYVGVTREGDAGWLGAARLLRRAAMACLLLLGPVILAVGTTRRVEAGPQDCPEEPSECGFKKPNALLVLEYSSAMTAEVSPGQTLWDGTVATITELLAMQNGYFDMNMRFAVLRYAHDPNPATLGTLIPGDTTGLVDGTRLDVSWYDQAGDPLDCNGASVLAVLDGMPPPPASGLLTWTAGALLEARDLIASSRADHPGDMDPERPRLYVNMAFSQGRWTSADGSQELAPPSDDPVPVANALFNDDDVPTYVFDLGPPSDTLWLDDLAMAGGTTASLSAIDVEAALEQVVEDIKNRIIIPSPDCEAISARIMVILDASSDMLNVGGVAGGPDETPWDQALDALYAMLNAVEEPMWYRVDDASFTGLIVFGDDQPSPGEQRVVFDRWGCPEYAFITALDPSYSCIAPGCVDPYAGPPIDWTFEPTQIISCVQAPKIIPHMPACQGPGPACEGSGRFTHLGLEIAEADLIEYLDRGLADPEAPFLNLLITVGPYAGFSTDTQVQAPLESMAAMGTYTRVVGFGPAIYQPVFVDELSNMAAWGSEGTLPPVLAADAAELENALAQIAVDLVYPPVEQCCFPPPLGCNTADPDCPSPEFTDTDTDTGTTTSATSTSGATTHSSTTGTSTDSTTYTVTSTDSTTNTGTSTDATTGTSTGTDSASGSHSSSASSSSSAPSGDTSTDGDAGSTDGGDDGADTSTDDSQGTVVTTRSCACRSTGRGPGPWLATLLLLATARRRRRRACAR
jgi:MYXO-CTERM domain-containing protein